MSATAQTVQGLTLPSAPVSRLSLNQATISSWTLPQATEACARAGLG